MEVLELAESFVNGLRAKPRTNVKSLQLCVNAKPSEVGLLAPDVITQANQETNASTTWPFPQVLNLGVDTVVFGADGVASLTLPDLSPLYIHDGMTPILTSRANPYTTAAGSNGHAPVIRCTIASTTSDVASVRCVVQTGPTYATTVFDKTATNVVAGDVLTFRATVYPNLDYRITVTPTYCTLVDSGTTPLKIGLQEDLLQQTKTKPFHGCHVGGAWFAASDEFFVFRGPAGGTGWSINGVATGYRARFVPHDVLSITTCCAFNERLYLAGFNGEDAHYADAWAPDAYNSWAYLWDTWVKSCDVETTHERISMGKNIVMYSRPNGGDFFDAFTLELSMLGIPDSATAFVQNLPYMLDSLRKGEMGFFEVPTTGSILRIAPHGAFLAIYCTDGVFLASPQPTERGLKHVVQKISTIRMHQMTADAYGLKHVILTNTLRLMLLQENRLQDLDYRSILSVWEGEGIPDICMSYDDEENDAYISSDTRCFILTRTGLGELLNAVTSVVRYNGELLGISYPLSDEPHPYYGELAYGNPPTTLIQSSVITETLDFGERMIKDFHRIEFCARNTVNLECRIHYRIDGTNWRVTPWFLVVKSGMTTPIVSGHDLKLEFRYYGVNADAQIEYVIANWRRNDKRNLRLYTTSFNGGA